MNTHTQTTWAPAVKLGTLLSIFAAIVGGALVTLGDVPQPVVVIGVMVVGFAASMTADIRATTTPPREPTAVIAHHRVDHDAA